MAHAVSPLAPAAFPEIGPVAGVRFATALTGTRYKDRNDLLLAAFAPGTAVAGVFTTNKMPGAPVDWCRKLIGTGRAAGLVVNAGNSLFYEPEQVCQGRLTRNSDRSATGVTGTQRSPRQ